MRTLDSIREEVAIREGFDSWDALIGAVTMAFVPISVLDVLITDIATMYAEEAIGECWIMTRNMRDIKKQLK